MWKKSIVAALLVSLIMLLVGAATQPAQSGCPPCWCSTIMQNTTITGLTKNGESVTTVFLGEAVWTLNGETAPVCVYAIWRIHDQGQDMQAYIELGKLGDDLYRMEIYHSWLTLSVDMPYSYVVAKETPHLLVLHITAELQC